MAMARRRAILSILMLWGGIWLRAKETEEMVGSESEGRGKQMGRSAGACMLWGGIWLRSKAKEERVESESEGRGSRAKGVLERVCCGVELATGEGKGGNGSR